MATIRRAGFGSVFEVENETVGIGTTGTATNTLQVLGDIKSSDATVIGLSTLTTYQGFVDKKARFGKALIDIESQAGTLGDVVIEGDVTVSSASTFCSSLNQLTLTDSFSLPTGNTDSRIHCHTAGSMRFNEDFGTLEFYTGDEWRIVNSIRDTGNRGRGVFVGGYGSSHETSIDFVNIQSRGNSQSFGSLSAGRRLMAGLGNSTRGIYGGGIDTGNNYLDTIEYITIQSGGNPIDFGNLTATNLGLNALASSTRGVFTGGYRPSPTKAIDVIQYVEIATLGDAIDFGDLNFPRYQPGSCSSPTRGIVAAGQANPANLTHIDFFTIASTGNATTFGDLGNDAYGGSSGASSTRGVFGGFNDDLKHIHFVTIASTGNSIYFGDLNTSFSSCASGTVSSQTRAIIAGGRNPSNVNTIESVEIATTGNAVDFGDRAITSQQFGGLSDSHGGLGGF